MYYFNILCQKKYGAEGIVLGLITSMILMSFWILPAKLYSIINKRKIR
jgi:hypothetical protein